MDIGNYVQVQYDTIIKKGKHCKNIYSGKKKGTTKLHSIHPQTALTTQLTKHSWRRTHINHFSQMIKLFKIGNSVKIQILNGIVWQTDALRLLLLKGKVN